MARPSLIAAFGRRVVPLFGGLLFACLTSAPSLARTCTWNAGAGGTGGGNWSTAAAWSCGTGGNGPPAAADTVIFNTTSIRPCAIDANADVISISINSGYTGTVTQNTTRTITMTGTFTQAAGTFMGGNSTIDIGGNLAVSAGAFHSTSSTMTIEGAFTLSGAGTFTHRSGTVNLTAPSNKTVTTNNTTFYNLKINDGLVGYWKFDEASSPSADSSPWGQTATWASTPTASTTIPTVAFANPRSIGFDSASDIASFTSSRPSPVISVAAWISPTGAGAGGYNRIVDLPGTPVWFTAGAGSDNNKALGMNSLREGAGVDGRWTSAPDSITYGVWQHVVATFDSSSTSNEPSFYVNGVSKAVTRESAAPTLTQLSNVGAGYIGNVAALNRNFYGLIDDLRIYDRIISAAEIALLAAGNTSTGTATHTLSGNLTVAGALTIDSGSLATSSYTLSVTGATSITSGNLTVGSSNVTLTGGLTTQSQGTVTQNTSGGHIILGTGQSSIYNDTEGIVEGFPTAAFNWSTFAYWNTYVAYNVFLGTSRLYARSADGAPKYYWQVPSGEGSIVGTPRWNMEGATHYVYVGTTQGRVYKLSDDGSTFAVASGWPYDNGGSATVTSPLAIDANNVYWCGNDEFSTVQMFSLALSTKVLNTKRSQTAPVYAAPALATISSVDYLFTGTNTGKVYRTPISLASEVTSTLATTEVNGRISVFGTNVMFAEDNGTIRALNSTTLASVWSYQDTNATRHPGTPACSAGNQCSVGSLYYDRTLSRTYFGDDDGHLYVLDSAGAILANYPWRPGASTDGFLTAPLYRSGVIVIGSDSAKVFVVDQNNGSSGPALIRTYTLNGQISSISFNTNAGSSGAYVVATRNGKLYYLANETDPTPGSI